MGGDEPLGTHGGFKLFRVLRWSEHNHSGWMCGVCHSLYKTEAKAQECLETCSAKSAVEFTNLAGNSLIHQCPLCAKRYAHMSDARLCAARCLQTLPLLPIVRKKVWEAVNHHPTAYANRSVRPMVRGKTGVIAQHLLDANWGQQSLPSFPIERDPPLPIPKMQTSPVESAQPPKPKAVVAIPTPHPHANPKPLPKNTTNVTPIPTKTALPKHEEPPQIHQVEEAAPLMLEAVDLTPPPASQPEVKGEVDPKLCRYPHQKPFKRMDARYECTVCHSKYFTKSDVEACFFSHPLIDEV